MTDTGMHGIQEAGKDAGPLDLVVFHIVLHGWWFGQPVVPAPPQLFNRPAFISTGGTRGTHQHGGGNSSTVRTSPGRK